MIDASREFGRAVARARKALGITHRELALAINSGERFIVELEAGKPTAQLARRRCGTPCGRWDKALAAAKAVGMRLTDDASENSGSRSAALRN